MEGRGQRWAARLKIDAERARAQLEERDPRKSVGERFETVPGRKSGVLVGRGAREADGRERRQSNAAVLMPAEKVRNQPPSHFSWRSYAQDDPLSFRHRMSVVMMHKEQVLTPPKSYFSGSSGGRGSPTSIPYIGPKRVAIVHDEGGHLWKMVGSRSSLVLGNKDSRRTLHVVNKPDSGSRSRWSIPKKDMEEGEKQQAP